MEGFLSKFKGNEKQMLAALCGTFFAISDGMHYGWTAPAIPKLLSDDSPIKATKHQLERLETILMFGSFCGLPLTIYCVDKIGRKASLIMASLWSLLAWILIAVAKSITLVYVARFCAGIAGDMAFVAAPIYIAEMSDQKIRGFLSSVIYLMMLTGVITVYCVTPFTPIYVPSLIGGGFVLLQLATFPNMPETPYYLLSKNKVDKAKKALQWFRKTENVDKEFEEIQAAVIRQKNEKGRPQDILLVNSNRKALVIMMVLNAAQHFSSISVMLMNLHLILQSAGSIYIADAKAAILFSLCMFGAALSSSLFMDKFGRKSLLIFSSFATGLCLSVIAIYFNLKNQDVNLDAVSWIPIVTVMIYALAFKSGLGLVPIVLTAELFPAKVKAIGMTIADASYVIWSIISLTVFQWLSDKYGIHVPFFVFAISCLLTATFTYFVIPETKGKSLEEIQYMLKGETPPSKNIQVSEKEQFLEE